MPLLGAQVVTSPVFSFSNPINILQGLLEMVFTSHHLDESDASSFPAAQVSLMKVYGLPNFQPFMMETRT